VPLLFVRAQTAAEEDLARTFLTTSLHITSSDVDRIDGAQVLSRTLDPSDKREVATLGVVRIRMTPEFYVERLADVAQFKRDDAVLQIGAFRNPPDLRDVAALTLDDSDLRSLRDCRVGSCGVQLPAAAIERFRGIDWQRADAPGRANVLMREILIEYVTSYLKAGSSANMQYVDQREPVNVAREFASLTDSDPDTWRRFPDLRKHLLECPVTKTAGTIDLVYWSKEKVGRRSVVSVTHLAISRTASESPADYVVASKHLYGTHYYDASLGLTLLVRDRSSSSSVTYLVYVNRSRVDVFGGVFGGITRKIVTSKARSTVADQLARLQRTLEGQFATAQPSGR